MLTRLIVIILQCTQILNRYVVYLKLRILLYVSYSSIKNFFKKKKKNEEERRLLKDSEAWTQSH